MDSRFLFALRSLGADIDRLPEIPPELHQWIAALTPEDLERIRNDVKEARAPWVGAETSGLGPDGVPGPAVDYLAGFRSNAPFDSSKKTQSASSPAPLV